MKSNKLIARTFGIFFLIAFASYGAGSVMLDEATNSALSLEHIYNNRNTIIIGVLLMALVHSVVNIALPVLMQPVLKAHGSILSTGYLSAGIAATLILVIGAIFLLLFIPLSEESLKASGESLAYMQGLRSLLIKGNFYAYQLGMAIWGVGGMLLCSLLYRSKLVPRFFAIWGLIGYLGFIVGTIGEMFELPIGLALSAPAGLFEISLSFYLIFKGFKAME